MVLRDGPNKSIHKIRLLYLFHFGFITYLVDNIVTELGVILGLYKFEVGVNFSIWHTNEH